MDHHDFRCRGGRWDHAHVVHMYVPVWVVMMVPYMYVRVVVMVMGNVVCYISTVSSMVGLVMLDIGTSLQINNTYYAI